MHLKWIIIILLIAIGAGASVGGWLGWRSRTAAPVVRRQPVPVVPCLNSQVYTDLETALRESDNVCQLDLRAQQLHEMPEAITSLTQLRILNLADNQLRSLPPTIRSLTQLTTLDVTGNPLPQSEEFRTWLRVLLPHTTIRDSN